MKAGFSLWELTYREFPVSFTGFGFTVYACKDGDVIYGWPIRGEISFICPYSPCKELCDFENSLFVFIFLEENNVILKFVLFALIFLVHTANMYSGITVKTHVKTVKLNYSGLLDHLHTYKYLPYTVQWRSVDGTINHCIFKLLLCTWSSNRM